MVSTAINQGELGADRPLKGSVTQSGASLEPPLSVPVQVGAYQIQRFVAEGGSAWVYQGVATQDGAEVALKLLKPHLSSEALQSSFLAQGRQLTHISSPYLPEVIEVGSSEWGPWWAMRWIEGPRLSELLSRGVQWRSNGVYHLAQRCCEALYALHKGGLIHGDVKPENLIYVGSPQSPLDAKMVLIDPRLSLPQGEERSALGADQPFIFGTPAYMSPEQLRGEPLTAASDLYSLGALLYQLTTGVCPFTGELTQLINDKLNAPVPLPSVRHRPWPYHAALEALILNLMSRNPSARFQSAGEVLALLHNAQSKEAPLPTTPSSAPWLSQTSPAEQQPGHTAPGHLAFDTADLEVTASDTLRALEPEDLEPFKPQAVIARRPTTERAKGTGERKPRPEWLGNLLWLCVGATLAIFIMRWLG